MKQTNIENMIIKTLAEKWRNYPYLRFGQLIVNIINPTEPCPEVFYVDDQEFYERLKKWES